MKHLQKKFLKGLSDWKNVIVPTVLVVGIIATLVMKNPVVADNGDSAAKGALFGGLTGAAIGGAAGGGKGAGIGLGAGLVGGAIFGGMAGRSKDSYDPYREQRNLERRIGRTRDPMKRAALQQELNNLNSRLQPQAGYPQPAYRPAGY